MMHLVRIPLAVVLCGVMLAAAVADDLNPPVWRGQPGTTWAEWEYPTPNPNPLPDVGYNPYGVPATRVYPGLGQVWLPELDGRLGVWPLSGEIWVDIPNRPDPNPWKDIYVQLTWEPQAPGNTPSVLTTLPQQVTGTLLHQTPLGGQWMHSVYAVHLEPNPAWEQILITGGINVDQLVIDTRCVPEPGTVALLAFGALAAVPLVWRAKRRAALLTLLAAVVFSSSLAVADDLHPPAWRGLPGTTFEEWKFLTPNPTPLPDLVNNPYGMPGSHVWPGTGQTWWPVWGAREGVWPLSGAMELYIPNAPPPNEYKDVWLQLTWAKQAFASAPIISSNPGGTIQLLSQVDIGPTGESPPAGANWWHSTYNLRIYPNPNFETIRIDGTVMVDQVVIDTICVPEPSTFVLLGMGAIGLLGHAWRRRKRTA
jgi:hypothetical protein